MGINSKIRNFKTYLSDGIWTENFENLSRMRAHLIKDLRDLIITVKTFSGQKIGFQAVALSFFCTMAAVPFIAIAFAITGGLGLEDALKEVLTSNIANQQAIDTLFGFAENIINTAQSSPVGLVSAVLFAWLVVWMMMCVESVFNNVWRVNKSRNILKRLSFYILIITVSPFVILLFFSGSIIYSNVLSSFSPDFLCHVQVHTQSHCPVQTCDQGGTPVRTGFHNYAIPLPGDTDFRHQAQYDIRRSRRNPTFHVLA